MSMAAAANLEMHCVDLSQAFIQASWADLSAHINDTLILCEDLGCDIVRDRAARTLTICQASYIRRILACHGMTDANPVKTPLQPGVCLTKRDCSAHPDPQLHHEYRAIVGHLSFLITMTRPDLAFAFAELSKFVQCPGQKHIKAAKRILAYLAGTLDEGITYSVPADPNDLHCLHGWVDSDFAADPDNCSSTSGFLISMNNGPSESSTRLGARPAGGDQDLRGQRQLHPDV